MNERIRKLLNEATSGLEPDISPQRTVTLNEMEKFAELIVKECADKCLAMAYVNPGPHHYAAMIKEHFGVKE